MHGLQDLLPTKVDRLGTMVCGLGGGYSLTGLVCGAVSAAVIAIGIDVAAIISNPIEARYHIERATRKFIYRFEAEFGSTLCRQITGINFLKDADAMQKMQELSAAGKLRCDDCMAMAVRSPLPSEEGRIP